MQITYEMKKDYIYFKIIGEYNDSEDFEKINDLCDIAKKHGFSTILIDVRDLNYDFDTFKRFNLSEYWVKKCYDLGIYKTAVIGIERRMDILSENVVNNRGFEFKLFTNEKEAIIWLSTSQIKKIENIYDNTKV
jgi:hypothetical protein